MNKLVILITIAIASIFLWGYGLKYPTFYGDSLGYYLYLPATFIYHNPKALNEFPKDKVIDPFIRNYGHEMEETKEQRTSKGYILDQYTYGIAFMEMPFFLIAHAYEKVNGLPATGYSDTYKYLIKISALFYSMLGLLLIYKILKNYFSSTISLLGIATIFVGTNLFWFTLFQAGMSHVPLFFLYALLMYLTIKVHERPVSFLFPAIGFIMGLITIIRPTDILCLLIPLLYNTYNRETLRKKTLFIKNNLQNMLFLITAFIIPIIPQLIYWKAVTGSYIFYSYGNQSFDWLHPKIIEGLFYFSNGWLPYSPVMIFSVIGILLYKHFRKWAWCIWLIIPLYIYIIYSWYCYRYINGLGSRPMIHLYPLLALPLAAFIQLVSQQKLIIKFLFASCFGFFIAVNISYSMQKEKRVINTEESNMVFNFQMLFRMNLRYNDLVVKNIGEKQPDTNKTTKLYTLACENYEDSVSDHYVHDTVYGSKYVYHMLPAEEYQQPFLITYNTKKIKGAKWFKCSGKFMYPSPPPNIYAKHLLVINIDDKLWKGCEIENKIDNWNNNVAKDIAFDYYKTDKWGYVYFYVKIPNNLKDGDLIKLFVWNLGKLDIYIDDLCLELYK